MKNMTVEECPTLLQADMDARRPYGADAMTSNVDDIVCVMEHLENLRDLRNALKEALE